MIEYSILFVYFIHVSTGTVAVGTSGGRVVMWSWTPPVKKGSSGDVAKHGSLSDHWELLSTANLTGSIQEMKVSVCF